MAATLDDLVAGVIGHVIVFVLLEQIVGAHLIALNEETLQKKWLVLQTSFTGRCEGAIEMLCSTYVLPEVNSAALQYGGHELVGVPSYRLGAFNARQFVALRA